MQILQSTSYWNMETPRAVDFTKKKYLFKKLSTLAECWIGDFSKSILKKSGMFKKKKLGGNIHGIFILPCRRAQFFVFNTHQ